MSGCANQEDAGPAEDQEINTSALTQIEPYRLGNATIFPNLEAGKDLNTKATVTNIGTENNPEYMVSAFVGNKGDTPFEAPMAFGFFWVTNEEAQIAAEQKGINPKIGTISTQNMLGATIEPGYGTDFVFYSGENTTELVELNDGHLRFRLEISTDPFKTGTGELLVYAINDLPTVIDNSTEPAQLQPGESMEIPLYKVGVDI